MAKKSHSCNIQFTIGSGRKKQPEKLINYLLLINNKLKSGS